MIDGLQTTPDRPGSKSDDGTPFTGRPRARIRPGIDEPPSEAEVLPAIASRRGEEEETGAEDAGWSLNEWKITRLRPIS